MLVAAILIVSLLTNALLIFVVFALLDKNTFLKKNLEGLNKQYNSVKEDLNETRIELRDEKNKNFVLQSIVNKKC